MTTDFRHFLDIDQFDAATLRALVEDAKRMKQARIGRPKGAPDDDAPLNGDVLAMVFEKPSTRTRVSFDMGMRQLGGQTIVLAGSEMQLGRGETIADTARVLSRYVDAIMLRTSEHENLLELAEHATVPVINALTDWSHPCQIMADIQTYEEHRGPIAGKVVAWSGDANNVSNSWAHAAVRFGFELRIASPSRLQPLRRILDWVAAEGGNVFVTEDPEEAVAGADIVVADTFVSMGQRFAERQAALLEPYQIDAELMALARPDALFMHCLPAHRGEEVTAEVIDGPQSVVWDEAENRLHAQKAILRYCLRGLSPC
jgi:ornithine carbamoyltransferase